MYTNQKVSIILAILRQQVDRDYGFPLEPVPYDLDVFFLNQDNDTYPIAVLENSVWPPKEEKAQLMAFGELFMVRTITQVTEPNSLYMEYSGGYRLSYIVKQFSRALMHYGQEHSDTGHVPETAEIVIHQFAYFLMTLTNEREEDTLLHIARFIMQLSLFKQCKPVNSVVGNLSISHHPLLGRDILHYLMSPDTLPTAELVYTFEYQGKTINSEQLRSLLPVSDLEDCLLTHIQMVHWREPVSSGITLSELVNEVYPAILTITDFPVFVEAYGQLLSLILEGLNAKTTYPVITTAMLNDQLHLISAAKKVNNEA